jgi:hypothetical protein
VCCQVEASATSWSLVQRSPTDCGVSQMCVIMKPRRNEEAQTHIGLSSHRKKKYSGRFCPRPPPPKLVESLRKTGRTRNRKCHGPFDCIILISACRQKPYNRLYIRRFTAVQFISQNAILTCKKTAKICRHKISNFKLLVKHCPLSVLDVFSKQFLRAAKVTTFAMLHL